MTDTLVCIPTLNEAENIGGLIDQLLGLYPGIHILVVDDNSLDGTSQIVEKFSKKNMAVRLLRRSTRNGFASAYIDAFRIGLRENFRWIVQMDADHSHDPKQLRQMLEVRNAVDFVVGSRYVRGGTIVNWSPLRKLISRCGNRYAAFWLGSSLADYTTGFTLWHRDVLEHIDFGSVESDGYSFLIELKYRALKAGFRGIEVPITFVDRRVGQSKMSWQIVFEAIHRVPTLRQWEKSSAPQSASIFSVSSGSLTQR